MFLRPIPNVTLSALSGELQMTTVRLLIILMLAVLQPLKR